MIQENLLLERFNSNDPEAFTIIYKRFFYPVYHYAVKFVNAHEAEDITANAFSHLYKMDKGFKRLQSIKNYLQKTVRHSAFNYTRHLKVVKQNEYGVIATLETEDNGFTEESKIETALLSRIMNEFEKLPTGRKKIIELFYFAGLKEKEVADTLGIGLGTVHNQKLIAVKQIRLILFSALKIIY